MARWTIIIWTVVMLCRPMAGLAERGAAEPVVLEVDPYREGDLLVCRLLTDGLPGEKLTLSMRSGLVSSIEFHLDVLDDDRDRLASNRVSFLLAFDLWEEIFSVRQDGREHRFQDTESMQRYLSELTHLPVAPLSQLEAEGPLQVRVGLSLHPIAPSQRERVEEVITGKAATGAAAGDQGREVSVGLGRLVRFFYKGGSSRPELEDERASPWFLLRELPDASD